MPNLELLPDGVTYENIKKNETEQAATSQYQDLNLQAQENQGQYQELVKTQETSVKLEITYENIRMESQNKSGTQSQSEPSQYEELNTGNDKKDEHVYSEVFLR